MGVKGNLRETLATDLRGKKEKGFSFYDPRDLEMESQGF
jgi:hypothetical protein